MKPLAHLSLLCIVIRYIDVFLPKAELNSAQKILIQIIV